jgi:hypothetical protein
MGHCAAQTSRPASAGFAGIWVQKWQGLNFRVLTIHVNGAVYSGSVEQPRSFTVNQDGAMSKIAGQRATFPLTGFKLAGPRLEFAFDDDRYAMTLVDPDHATLMPLDEDFPFPAWKIERGAEGASVAVNWPAVRYPAEIVALQKRLKSMVRADQKARMAKKVSFKKMAAIDRRHTPEILRVHAKYGWPGVPLVGSDASHDYWLLVQHQTPEVQRKILPDLERAANSGEASKSDYAYLYDRVQVGLGKPQRFGTQVKCVGGKPVLDAVEDPGGLDRRRQELMMMPVDRYLKADYLVKMCATAGK